MPTYTYRNTETGEEWTEVRSLSTRLDGVDGKRIIQVLCAPKTRDYSFDHKRQERFNEKVLDPIRKKIPGHTIDG